MSYKFYAEDRANRYKESGRPFGQPNAARSTWETWPNDADSERAVMCAEFHVWLVKTRIATERDLLSDEAHLKSIAPFASAGLEGAATPQDVPLCVLEFASSALQVMELKRKLDLCNVYYSQAVSDNPESYLNIEPGNEAEVNDLWAAFIKERGEEKK
jgi:hypothetical protein